MMAPERDSCDSASLLRHKIKLKSSSDKLARAYINVFTVRTSYIPSSELIEGWS